MKTEARSLPAGWSAGRAIALAVPCVLAGVVVGVLIAREPRSSAAGVVSSSAPTSAPPQPTSITVLGPATARLDGEDKDALRQMVREELEKQRASTEARANADKEARDNAPLAPEQIKSYDAARASVDQGIASGSWTQADVSRLRADVASLPSERRMEIVAPLIIAVNSGKVHFDGHGPLF